MRAELLLLCQHFHPTVQVFAESVLNQKKISYYGDPLKDFSLAHFLERFVFKNPKKNEKSLSEVPQTVQHKNYISYGSRGKSVKSLTRTNCTEDEKFIFQYLEKKRLKQVGIVKKSKDDEDIGDVDDDEFEAYLDKLGAAGGEEVDDELDEDFKLDYLKEIGGELKESTKSKKKKSIAEDDDEDMEDIDKDWGDEDGDGEDNDELGSDEEELELDGDDDDGSVEFEDSDEEGAEDEENGEPIDDEDDDFADDLSDDSGGDGSEDDEDEDDEPKAKKSKPMMGGKAFAKTLKDSTGNNFEK